MKQWRERERSLRTVKAREIELDAVERPARQAERRGEPGLRNAQRPPVGGQAKCRLVRGELRQVQGGGGNEAGPVSQRHGAFVAPCQIEAALRQGEPAPRRPEMEERGSHPAAQSPSGDGEGAARRL